MNPEINSSDPTCSFNLPVKCSCSAQWEYSLSTIHFPITKFNLEFRFSRLGVHLNFKHVFGKLFVRYPRFLSIGITTSDTIYLWDQRLSSEKSIV